MPLYYTPTQNGIQKTLDSALLTAATASVALNNVTGIQNKAGMFVVDRIDANGVSTPSKREYVSFAGTSGTTLVTLVRGLGGSSDQDHTVGAIVEFIPDVIWAQAINDAITAEHSTSGAHDATKVLMIAGAQTATGAKTFTTGLLKAVDVTSGAGVSTFPTSTDTLVGKATTDTLTNKRITKRVLSAASYTTDTGTSLNCDTLDEFIVTAQTGALKLNNPSGTAVDGQMLMVAVTGTAARVLTYDTQFEASTVALPTTTVTTARLNMLFTWANATSKWIIVAAV